MIVTTDDPPPKFVPPNNTANVIRYLQVVVKFSGWRIDQPDIESFIFDADQVALTLPVEMVDPKDGRRHVISREYKLWELTETVLLEHPHILRTKYDLIDAWVWESLLSRHPKKNKILDYRLKTYESKPIPKKIRYDSLLDELL